MPHWYRALRLGAVSTVVALVGGCTATMKESGVVIESYVTQVSDGSGTILGTLQTGDPPAPNGGPSNTVAGFPAMVSGGSAQQTVSGSAAFTRVIIKVPGATNYYELILPTSASHDVVVNASSSLPDMQLPIAYAVGDPGTLGAYTTLSTRVIHVGSGDVQVSVSWSDSSDVDLHVVDPSSEEIYYSHRTSASGGTLDLDANAGCSAGSEGFKSNENVVWPTGQGAHGTYTVRLDYWSKCTAAKPTDYIVTVAVAGSAPQIFHGSFTGSGDGGGAGSGTLITTFTY